MVPELFVWYQRWSWKPFAWCSFGRYLHPTLLPLGNSLHPRYLQIRRGLHGNGRQRNKRKLLEKRKDGHLHFGHHNANCRRRYTYLHVLQSSNLGWDCWWWWWYWYDEWSNRNWISNKKGWWYGKTNGKCHGIECNGMRLNGYLNHV